MIFNAMVVSLLMSIQGHQQFKTSYVVQATIDAAKIIGLPASKITVAKALAQQQPEFLEKEAMQDFKPLPWRKIFFQKYFN